MAIFDWFNKQLDNLRDEGHAISPSLENFQKDYSKQVNEANELLQEKQAREKERQKSENCDFSKS